MPTLLHIDSSPIFGSSVSRELTAAFVAEWHSVHPGGAIIDRDLTSTSIPPVTAEWVGAAYTPEHGRTLSRNNSSRSPTRCSPNWIRLMSM